MRDCVLGTLHRLGYCTNVTMCLVVCHTVHCTKVTMCLVLCHCALHKNDRDASSAT